MGHRQGADRAQRSQPRLAACEEAWRLVVEHARDVLARFDAGKAGFGFERTAAPAVLTISKHVAPREAVGTTLARHLQPAGHPRLPLFPAPQRAMETGGKITYHQAG